ncbi:MAG: oxamate carbamoyltransferase subunit AllH family protein [Nocardioidaceae bacterium]
MQEAGCTASSLVAVLLDGPDRSLPAVVRTSVSVHYETGLEELPVLCVCTPGAVLLPNVVVVDTLPAPGPLRVSARGLSAGTVTWRVRRWFAPPRPTGLVPPLDLPPFPMPAPVGYDVPLPGPSYDGLVAAALVGAGPGLTPAGDDVLAGALVTAHATDDPRLPSWRAATRAALAARRTTAVSRGLLRHALDGWATPELAAYLTALCSGDPLEGSRQRLLGVGSSSGAALIAGVHHTLSTRLRQGAA